jgi:hypothetical protein
MWELLKRDAYKRIFAPDCRSLLAIRVFDTNSDDWQLLLDYLSANNRLAYSEDGKACSLPKFEAIWRKHNEKTLLLQVMLPGFTANCHFFDNQQIQIDLLPEDVNSPKKGDAVFGLMNGMATVLNKTVFLTPEFAGASAEELRNLAVYVADPKNHSI